MAETLSINAAALFVYMTAAYVIAYYRQRLDTVDVAWGIGFIVVAWSSYLQHHNDVSLLLAVLVTVWGARLASHIGQRSLKSLEDDARYTELSKKWRGNFWLRAYTSIFLLQGALIWIVSLPVSLASGYQSYSLSWLTVVGVWVWIAGFTIEAIADRQLRDFLSRSNHPKLFQGGLWRYSRHPNYFGELTQWYGIAIIALQVNYGWIGFIGPLVLTYLIMFVSGLPPIERAKAKDAEYQAYKKHTSALVPLPPRENA